ncbi:MAG: PD-(D/E)XK nuclease domain-containing protein [Acidobacteriaceae bacterium]
MAEPASGLERLGDDREDRAIPMVPVEKENAYQLRDYLYRKAGESAHVDPFKSSFLYFLGLSKDGTSGFELSTLSLYQRCAISGLGILEETVTVQEVSRLLGQAAKIDSTPRPWVSDVFGVMAVGWLVVQINDDHITREFDHWTSGFLAQQVSGDHLSLFEKDIAAYVRSGESAVYASACVPLFLYYRKMRRIDDHQIRLSLISRFMDEFRAQARGDASTALLSLMVYVFDQVNQDVAVVPPTGWTLGDLLGFLDHIPVGLKRWTWDNLGRTKGATPVKWRVENEYHVQNLLYVLLAPVFNDIADEVYLQPVGQKTPRIDLYLPSLHTIIEVKYRKDTKKSFQALIGEIAEDASLYRAGAKYKDALIVNFLWDCTRATQEHAKFKEGVLKIYGVKGCVVISAPSTMNE